MREFKTILCPTDFSEDSYRALDYGARFAKAADGTLLIAHVIHVASGDLLQDAETAGEDRAMGLARGPGGLGAHVLKFDDAKRRMAAKLEEARQHHTQGYPKCELIIDIGDPYQRLLAITTERKVDLIVIATHGLGGLQQLVMGSVAEKLIRHAPCPMFVVRRGAA